MAVYEHFLDRKFLTKKTVIDNHYTTISGLVKIECYSCRVLNSDDSKSNDIKLLRHLHKFTLSLHPIYIPG